MAEFVEVWTPFVDAMIVDICRFIFRERQPALIPFSVLVGAFC